MLGKHKVVLSVADSGYIILLIIVREHSLWVIIASGRTYSLGSYTSPTASVLGFRLVSHQAEDDNNHFFHFLHFLEPDHCLRLFGPTKHLKAFLPVSRANETFKQGLLS